jgi:hypothetical protein
VNKGKGGPERGKEAGSLDVPPLSSAPETEEDSSIAH